MDAKEAARQRLERERERLIDLSHRIHATPELAFEEERSSAWTAEALSGAGFAVTPNVAGLPTAFTARAGEGPLRVAICAEYDCLPGIGHACGHNIIAASAVGAAIAAAAVADDLGLTVTVVGTPAEESGGGKIILLEDGVFAGQHAAMMVHPAPYDAVRRPLLAMTQFGVTYRGKASHASAYPELGVNAADALTVAQTAIGLLRQHLRPADRVHGIVTHAGDAPNVVPALATATYQVRATTVDDLDDVYRKVRRCFDAGALATGAELSVEEAWKPYAEMRHDAELATLYRANAERLGRTFSDTVEAKPPAASTDMGNVSQMLPSIHPFVGIDSSPAVNHEPAFAAHCVTPAADKALADGALGLAWTAIDIASDESLAARLMG
ncbi:MAG TPA: amidohydrolase [Actinomycetota bacterium]|nr:amidohydrolase [Actinomycetota bacterium]